MENNHACMKLEEVNRLNSLQQFQLYTKLCSTCRLVRQTYQMQFISILWRIGDFKTRTKSLKHKTS